MKRLATPSLLRVLLLALTALATLGATASAQAPATSSPAAPLDAKALGRSATAQFYASELEDLWKRFSATMRTAFKDKEQLQKFRTQVTNQAGEETSVVDEVATHQGDFDVYVRTTTFSKVPMPVIVQWAFNAEGEIDGFYIRPQATEAASRYLDYQTKTPLRLPFDGEWTVFWGGRTVAQNYHAAVRDQRFAYDILIFKDGVSHSGDGTKLEQFYAYGKPILAPGAGTVVVAADGLPDNTPGVMDREHPPGNHVIIDHGNGEYSLLAHLQKGSIKVKKGDVVKAGDPLALCGNSGNTSEPHLHYHLQTGSELRQGEGLPAQFLHYLANGVRVERGEPVKGQKVENTPPPAPEKKP
jgi:murein DD-endopeptidase MepM/ murein hydrolase activator NlpD